MEYLLGTVCCFGLFIGVPYWLWASAKRQRALEEYTWSLMNWEFSEDGFSYRINFPEMRAYFNYTSYDGPGADEKKDFAVRRLPDGVWESFEKGDWHPISPGWNPAIETAYQRYIHRS